MVKIWIYSTQNLYVKLNLLCALFCLTYFMREYLLLNYISLVKYNITFKYQIFLIRKNNDSILSYIYEYFHYLISIL